MTRLAVYASCSRLACTAPAAAIAALMPQIDTADDSSARSRSSSPSRPPSHQVNPNTTLIRTSACRMAGPAAVTITAKLIDAPSSTSPVLMKNSVRKPPASRSRRPSRVSTTLPSRPSRIAYTGNSIAAAIAGERGALGGGGHGLLEEAGERRRGRRPRRRRRARPGANAGTRVGRGCSRVALLQWDGAGPPCCDPAELRVSVWSLIRAPASRAAGPSAPAPAGAGRRRSRPSLR